MQKSTLARVFNGFGYLALYIQIAWLFLLFLPSIADSDILTISNETQNSAPTVPVLAAPEIDPTLSIILTAVILAGVVGFTVYAVVKGPGIATDAGETATTRAADIVLPLVTHHKKLSKKKRLELSFRLQYFVKLSLCFLAFVLIFTTLLVETSMPFNMSIAIGAFLLPWGVLWFSLAHLLKRTAKN